MRRLVFGVEIFAIVAMVGVAFQSAAQVMPPHPTLPKCQAGDPNLLLPDLVPEVPRDSRNVLMAGRRFLQFTTGIGNIGDGPLLIEGRTISTPQGLVTQGYQLIDRRDGSRCARVTGQFEYHPGHKHWHFERMVGYELRSVDPDNGPEAARGDKASFCLLDLASMRGYNPLDFPRQLRNLTCDSPDGIMGISVGWKDVYDRFLPGQNIDLDADRNNRVQVGVYFLVNNVDPDGLLWDKNRENNRSSSAIDVTLRPGPLSQLPPPVAPPTPSLPRPHIRPGHDRPPRGPRPTVPRAPRPTRGPRGGDTPKPGPQPTPTQTVGPASCQASCLYNLSQVRFTWYDSGGLNLSFAVMPGSCPRLTPDAGKAGSVALTNWLKNTKVDTGLSHRSSFVLDAANTGVGAVTSNGGTLELTPITGGHKVVYLAPDRPFARMSDGIDFPVVFDMCLKVGNQAVFGRLVCQPKPTGMLCHEG